MKQISQLIKLRKLNKVVLVIALVTTLTNARATIFTVTSTTNGGQPWLNACTNLSAYSDAGSFAEGIRQANRGLIDTIDVPLANCMINDFWSESLNLCANNILIRSTSPGAGILQSNGSGSYFFQISGNGNRIDGLVVNAPIVVRGNNNTLENLTISHGLGNDGIRIMGGDNNIISNNTITFTSTNSQRHGIYLAEGANSNQLINNDISDFLNGILIGLDQSGGSFVVNDGNTLSGNTISSVDNHGIWLRESPVTNTAVLGNTVTNSLNANIYLSNNVNGHGNYLDANITHSSIQGAGIYVENSNGAILTNNIVGSDITAVAQLGNYGHGIVFDGGSGYQVGTIGNGNIIIDNGNAGPSNTDGLNSTGHGIIFVNGVTSSFVHGNIIGTDVGGTMSLGNDMSGIYIERLTEAPAVDDNNEIGGANPGEGNLIGNNGAAHIPFLTANTYTGPRSGIQIWQSHGNVVKGNLIGTNGSGSNIGNYQEAITLNGADRNQIGGSTTAESNILTNSRNGIALRYGSQFPSNVSSDNNIISGNIVGTDLSGNTGLGNASNGISIETESDNNIIGGSTATEGNLIVATGAGPGIWITGADNNEIYNNQIGNVLGLVPLHENAGSGILVESGSLNNIIGSTTAGNTISNKLAAVPAISISGGSTTGNTIVGNITSCNAGRGIELNNTGNNNYASTGSGSAAQLYVNNASTSGNYSGIAPANARVDIYDIGTCNACSDSDNGLQQGALWRGFVMADASGDWTSTITSTNGIVVTATDASGNTSEFSQCVTICTSPGTATITPSTSEICQGETSTLTASPAGFDYTWYDGAGVVGTNQTFDAVVSGTYYVVIADPADPTNTTCQVTSSNASVTVHSLPNAGTISGTNPVCEGYTETFSTTATGVTYDWSTSEGSLASANGNATIDIDFSGASSGTITLDVEDVNNCTNSATFDFTVNATPNTTGIAGATDLCENTAGEVYTASSDFGTSYAWTVSGDATFVTGPGVDQITVDFGTTDPITITATASDNGCADQTASQISVNVNSAPATPTISGSQNVACNTNDESYSVTSPNGGSTYAWTVPSGASIDLPDDGSTISVDFGTSSGNITVVETNSDGCSSGQASLAVSLSGCGLEANFNVSSDSVCEGGTITFTDQSSFGVAIDSWTWDFGTGATPATATGQGPHNVTYSTAGTATVSLIVTEGVATDDTIAVSAITINSTPTSAGTISGATTVCANTIGETYDVAPSSATSTYAWTSPGTIQPGGNIGPGNDQILVDFGTSGGTISVVETTQSGCVSPASTLNVNVNDVPVLTGPINQPSTTICDTDAGQQYTFSFPSVSNEDALVWTVPSGATIVSGQGTNSVVVDFTNSGSNQTVSVEATNTCGAVSLTSDAFEIEETVTPQVFINGGGAPVCGNDDIDFNAISSFSDPGGITYVWYVDGVAQAGNSTDLFTWVNPGFAQDITVEAIPNSLTCLSKTSDTSDVNTITVLPTPNAEAGDDQTIEDLQQIILSGGSYEALTTQSGVTYTWTSSVDNNEITNSTPATVFETVRADPTEDVTTYYLVVDNGSCSDIDSMTVTVQFLVWIPSGFSPNNDANNDDFQIKNIEKYPGNRVEVYNRWGSLVYESDNYGINGAEFWDGTYNGKDLPMATYYYVVKLNDADDQEFAGPVTIIK